MHYQHLIQQFDLLSHEPFGLFEKSGIRFTKDWQEEDDNRERIFSNAPPFSAKITDEIKQMARMGIPHCQRRKWWLIASGGLSLLAEVGDVYSNAIKAASRYTTSSSSQFGGGVDILNFLPSAISSDVQQFLHIVWCQNRQISFSPLIPTIATLLLLYMEPPLAYLSIQAMINSSKKDSWYFTLDQEQFLASIQAFRDLCASKCPQILRHADSLNINVAHIGLALFPVFFLPFMPIPVALTLFDSFVFEGRKILVRFCLNLFTQRQQLLLETQSAKGFIDVLVASLESLSEINSMKLFIKSSFHIYLTRKRHMHRLESRAMEDKIGILGNKRYSRAKNISEMFSDDFHGLIVGPSSAELPPESNSDSTDDLFSIDTVNTEYATQLLSSVTPEAVAITHATIQKQIAQCALPSVVGGALLDHSLFYSLRERFPSILKLSSADLVFSVAEHGTSLLTLFSLAKQKVPHIIIAKTEKSTIGALLSDPLRPDMVPVGGRYYGKPMCFVFNATTKEIYRQNPTPNQMFISVTPLYLMIGGPRAAIYIEDGFGKLISEQCDTFGSPPLIGSEDGEAIVNVEVYQLVGSYALKRKI